LPHIAPSTHIERNDTTSITTPPSNFNPPTSSSVSPNPSSICFAVLAIISRGKGKSKLILDEDDLPLAQLKKLKTERHISDSSISDLESAAFSLTKLQGDPYFKGPVHKFLTSPLLGSQGQMVDFMPTYGGGFDALSEDSQYGHNFAAHSKIFHFGSGFAALSKESQFTAVASKNTCPPYVPAVCGAHSILQVPYTSMPASMDGSEMSSDHMDIHQAHVSPATMAVSQGPLKRRFFRASRGNRLVSSIKRTAADLIPPTEASDVNSLSDVDNLGESPLKPPPQV
jgi:hypothetical protein